MKNSLCLIQHAGTSVWVYQTTSIATFLIGMVLSLASVAIIEVAHCRNVAIHCLSHTVYGVSRSKVDEVRGPAKGGIGEPGYLRS